ncbi:unnamed protein product [Moneuplotes crassus]|uniref:Uncharacterized protein n=1 Tax=Euplotes crassus TaxID=5936 RepID=A0AAD2D6E5_EUPCR|nr:unnamed protein product [Moneuplotes crassus]
MKNTNRNFRLESYKVLCNSIASKKEPVRKVSRRRDEMSPVLRNQMFQTIIKLKGGHNYKRAFSPQIIRKMRPESPQYEIKFSPHASWNQQKSNSAPGSKHRIKNGWYYNLISKIRTKMNKSGFKNRRFISPHMLRNKADLLASSRVLDDTQLKGTTKVGDFKKRKHPHKLPILKQLTSLDVIKFDL